MPELPDIVTYLHALQSRILDQPIETVRLQSPFLLRTAEPALETAEGKRVVALRRLGKRIAIGLADELWLVLHLMIAGRLHWKAKLPYRPVKRDLLALLFPEGALTLTEAGSRHRASLHVVVGAEGLEAHQPGGLEIDQASLRDFTNVLKSCNHTLKRALTNPRLFSGIGNAYSDEILHRGRLSPVQLSQKLTDEQIERLFLATRETLADWSYRLTAEAADKFPERVTAFHKGMAVHGRYGEPCPVCGTEVQRIRYAENEANYCPRCQTGGRVLADRVLSRLLKQDWPRTIEELERL